MDTRDVVIGGLVVVGGYFAYRWWCTRAVSDPLRKMPDSVHAAAASSMTNGAAGSTIFGGATFLRRLLAPQTATAPQSPKPSPTGSAGALAASQASSFISERARVLNATLAPLPVAPSPSSFLLSSTGILAASPTMPNGERPGPGSPGNYVLQTRGIA